MSDTTSPHRAGTDDDRSPGPWRGRLVLVGVALAILIGVALVAGPDRPGLAYDPSDPGPLGLAGAVDLLRSVGVHVEVSRDLPTDMSTHLFIARDQLREDVREEVIDWIEEGGTAIVAGASPIHGLQVRGAPVTDAFGATAREPGCDAPGLRHVDRVEHAGWDALEVPTTVAWACFPVDEDGAWLVAQELGDGVVVALGSVAPLVNANLGRADNAVLAAALLGAQAADRVVFVPPAAVGEGDQAVVDLVPSGFWRLLALLSVAVVLAIVGTARRLGPPVEERLPPVLPGAELVRSVAGLLQRSRNRATAAGRLRTGARRRVERAWGLPAHTEPRELVGLVTSRAGLDRRDAETALLDQPVGSDDELLGVGLACSRLHDHLDRPASQVGRTPVSTDEPAADERSIW